MSGGGRGDRGHAAPRRGPLPWFSLPHAPLPLRLPLQGRLTSPAPASAPAVAAALTVPEDAVSDRVTAIAQSAINVGMLSLVKVRLWPAWKCSLQPGRPSLPGTPTPPPCCRSSRCAFGPPGNSASCPVGPHIQAHQLPSHSLRCAVAPPGRHANTPPPGTPTCLSDLTPPRPGTADVQAGVCCRRPGARLQQVLMHARNLLISVDRLLITTCPTLTTGANSPLRPVGLRRSPGFLASCSTLSRPPLCAGFRQHAPCLHVGQCSPHVRPPRGSSSLPLLYLFTTLSDPRAAPLPYLFSTSSPPCPTPARQIHGGGVPAGQGALPSSSPFRIHI